MNKLWPKSRLYKSLALLFVIWILSLLLLVHAAHKWRPSASGHVPADNKKKNSADGDGGSHSGRNSILLKRTAVPGTDGVFFELAPRRASNNDIDGDGRKHSSSSSSSPSTAVQKLDKKDDEYVAPTNPAITIPTSQNSSSSERVEKLKCFVVVVSNEAYIDGALVLGYSINKHSNLAIKKKAELVVIVPEGAISDDSIERLHLAGWTHVLQVDDLAKKAPKAHWASTFNKLYLFNLVQYSLVAFFDADMLMQHSPDFIFRTKLKDYKHIGALGNSLFDRHGKARPAYFQTGMMLIIPSKESFKAMMDDFNNKPENRQLNGRDGLIVRRYFGSNYKNLDDALSAHVGTTNDYDWVTGLHFRGGFKPWFNRAKVSAYDADEVRRLRHKNGKHAELPPKGKWLEIGPAYTLWWETYEEFHAKEMVRFDHEKENTRNNKKMLKKKNADGGGDASAGATGDNDNEDNMLSPPPPPEGYDPLTHVWMMRHSKKSYIQLRMPIERARRLARLAVVAPSPLSSSGDGGENNNNNNNAGNNINNDDAHDDRHKQPRIARVTELVVGNAGESCDVACVRAGSGKRCEDAVLASPALQSCDAMREHFKSRNLCGFDEREKNVEKNDGGGRKARCYTRAAPTNLQPDSSSCSFNTMLNPFIQPLCNASLDFVSRLCLCVVDASQQKNQHHQLQNQQQLNRGPDNGEKDDDEKNANKKRNDNNDDGNDDAEEEERKKAQRKQQQQQQQHHMKKMSHESHLCEIDGASGLPKHQCVTRLADVEHSGSWSVLPRWELDDDDDHHAGDGKTGDHSTKRSPSSASGSTTTNTSSTNTMAILARHHDGVRNTIWFPQRSIPDLLQRVVFAHMVGRVLGVDWVPPTVTQHWTLKTTPKRLNKLHNDQLNREVVSYLMPVRCPEVESDGDSWGVRAVTSWHRRHEDGESLADLKNATQYGEAALMHFVLGVHFKQRVVLPSSSSSSSSFTSGGGHLITWERLMAHINSVSGDSRAVAMEMPTCDVLRAAGASMTRLSMLDAVLRSIAESKHAEFLSSCKQMTGGRFDPSFWKLDDERSWEFLQRGKDAVKSLRGRISALHAVVRRC